MDKMVDHSELARSKAKDLISEIFVDTDIPTGDFKDLLQRHPRIPSMHCFLKDHKETFPSCPVRPVQPVKNSAIET